MNFYFAGQDNFGNRGCEALIRSIMGMVHDQHPQATFDVPTSVQALDAVQWPDLAALGGKWIRPSTMPASIKWWNRVVSRAHVFLPIWEPHYELPQRMKDTFAACSAVVMTGGDIISLDYGYGNLFRWSGLMDGAGRAGCPTMLFAASVGPFDREPFVERLMREHLRRYTAITVRESASFEYLRRLGIDTVQLTADPAFCLMPEPTDPGPVYASAPEGVLAFNISPLVAAGWQRRNPGKSLTQECAAFLRRVLDETRMSVALLPHVDPLDGAKANSDSHYMEEILRELGGSQPRVGMVRRGLNAAQIKHVIGQSRYLIAARTHATIAGWSKHVPTISIAYSIKARGLNQDLFGNLDYVLETPKVNRQSLWDSFLLLTQRESDIRAGLQARIPERQSAARRSADILLNIAR